jgi:NADP-dependent aldehyde dehydrogenase
VALDSPALRRFEQAAAQALAGTAAATMLTPGIHQSYCAGVAKLQAQADVQVLGRGQLGNQLQGQAALFATSADVFLSNHALRDEVFGSTSLIVRCPDEAMLLKVLKALEGQLTIAVHLAANDQPALGKLLPVLEHKAGRILINGFGTGVEVCHAMVHGGPFPATSDTRTTSVGSLAINRFLRPVSYQDLPADLLPEALQDGNPLGIAQRINGAVQR